MNTLNLFVNDQPTFEYNRSTELGEAKMAFLDKMDSDMDSGFRIKGKTLIEEPS